MFTPLRTLIALLALALPQAAAASTLKITTDPPGAAVQVDGVAYGPSPLSLPKLAPGSHELRVSAEGYVSSVDTIQVSGGEDLQVLVPLNPVPRLVAPRPSQAPPVQAPVPPQPPAYAPPAPAAAPIAAPIAARPLPPAPPRAQPAAPNAPLPVSQLPIAWGTQKKSITLRVDTVPAGASVQVVGMPEVRPAPAVFTGFSPGTVTLLVRAPGYQDAKVAVDLAGDSRTQVTLEPLSR